MDTYSNKVPSTSVDDGFLVPAPGNTPTGVVTREIQGLSAHCLPYSNIQLQEAIQNHYGGDYYLLDAPEGAVWATMAQPTIGFYQSPYFICILTLWIYAR